MSESLLDHAEDLISAPPSRRMTARRPVLPGPKGLRTAKVRGTYLNLLEAGITDRREAAKACGFTERAFQKWRRDDPEFAQDCSDAWLAGAGELETAAYERALSPFLPGSTQALLYMLSARDPERYCAPSRAAKIKAQIEALVNAAQSKDTTEQRDALAKMLEALEAAK